jgi:ADP-ribose pyrophosphatase
MHEQRIASRTAYQGRYIRLELLDIRLPSGRPAVREVIRHPGAAVVLPETPDGRFVLIRQYRRAVDRELIEAVAGTLAPPESPEECGRRELEEETGYRARSIRLLGTVYPAPGYTDERMHLYHAKVDAAPAAARPEEDEQIAVVLFRRDEIEALIASGGIEDAKTIAVWTLHRAATEAAPV